MHAYVRAYISDGSRNQKRGFQYTQNFSSLIIVLNMFYTFDCYTSHFDEVVCLYRSITGKYPGVVSRQLGKLCKLNVSY